MALEEKQCYPGNRRSIDQEHELENSTNIGITIKWTLRQTLPPSSFLTEPTTLRPKT